MEQTTDRREFMKESLYFCAGCALLMTGCNRKTSEADEIDIDSLTYCGYDCEGCDALKATVENNIELKKSVHERWGWKERLNVDFDPDVVFCWGCKPPEGKPINKFQEVCSVRVCAVEKGKKNCILCDELVDCQKELWDRFPGHKEYVIGLQNEVDKKM